MARQRSWSFYFKKVWNVISTSECHYTQNIIWYVVEIVSLLQKKNDRILQWDVCTLLKSVSRQIRQTSESVKRSNTQLYADFYEAIIKRKQECGSLLQVSVRGFPCVRAEISWSLIALIISSYWFIWLFASNCSQQIERKWTIGGLCVCLSWLWKASACV